MGKDLEVAMLLDFYGDLLTEKQAQALDLYYNEDLSLSEIASPLGITRPGARDFIKRGEKQLYDFENALGLAKRFKDIEKEIVDISKEFSKICDNEESTASDELKDALSSIKERLSSITKML